MPLGLAEGTGGGGTSCCETWGKGDPNQQKAEQTSLLKREGPGGGDEPGTQHLGRAVAWEEENTDDTVG